MYPMTDCKKINRKCSEGNSPLVVRAFAMGAERTVRDNTVGSGSFGGPRERLMAIKIAESLFFNLYDWYFQDSLLLISSKILQKRHVSRLLQIHAFSLCYKLSINF